MHLSDAHDLQEEILATLPSFAAREEATPSAIAVGIAPTERAGEFRVAVRPRYDHELPPAALRYLDRVTTGQIEVRITGPITARAARLTIGASTTHVRGRLGTLGCFARRNDDGRVGFISNNHVIAAEDTGADGDDILHLENGRPVRVVGWLAGDYPRLRHDPQIVDCAFAYLADGVDYEPILLESGARLSASPVSPVGQVTVRKLGRTTGRTQGRITAFALKNVVVNYTFGDVRFEEQIEIESLTAKPFSAPGDSGALVFTDDGDPVGLLHAGSSIGGYSNAGLTYANPISAVVDALGITLLT